MCFSCACRVLLPCVLPLHYYMVHAFWFHVIHLAAGGPGRLMNYCCWWLSFYAVSLYSCIVTAFVPFGFKRRLIS